MVKKEFSASRDIVDNLRTAPFGEFLTTLGLILLVLSAYDVNTASQTSEMARFLKLFGTGTFFASSILNGATGVLLISRQFRIRKRLEDHLEAKGFNENYFLPTVPEWCVRQTARVATERYGCLDQYENLCRKKTHLMENKIIPHF